MLLKDKNDFYYNEEVNAVFDQWNKKYGNNIKLDEDDNKDKNNLNAVCMQVKHDLNKIEIDDDKVINSLISFLYKKPSIRKKKLLWYIYGEQIYNNLCENVDHKNICRKCGKRTNEVLIRGKCDECRKKDYKIDNRTNMKTITCVDCGKKIKISIHNKRTTRCKECQNITNKEREKLWQRELRKKS